MSYQINPYLKNHGMLMKGKQMSELQRLKQQFDRIKEFNEYTIAARVRQVRLRRLFREIEQINAESAARAKPPRPPPKTYAQKRKEELSRAREIGIEYSRGNAYNVQRYGPVPASSMFSFIEHENKIGQKVASTARRIRYGNLISGANMNRFTKINRHSKYLDIPCERTESSSSMHIDKLDMLREHIENENAKTNEGIIQRSKRQSKKHRKYHSLEKQSDMNLESQQSFVNADNNSELELSTGTNSEREVVKNYTLVLNGDNIMSPTLNGTEDISITCNIETSNVRQFKRKSRKQKALQHMYSQRISERSNRANNIQEDNENVEIFEEITDKDEAGYELRRIDNDRNLPLSHFGHKMVQSSMPAMESNEDVTILQSEQLIKISNLNVEAIVHHENVPVELQTYVRKALSDETMISNTQNAEILHSLPIANTALSTKPLANIEIVSPQNQAILQSQVKDFVKLYEPFPRESAESTRIKENYETGVAKLRSIFEHQGD